MIFIVSHLESARIDLSTYTDLTDEKDDSKAFNKAVADAGSSGVIYIPSGKVILNSPVKIRDKSLTIIGEGLTNSFIMVGRSVNGAGLRFLSTERNKVPCRWRIRDLSIKPDSPKVGAALSLKDESGVDGNARMKITDVRLNSGLKDYFEQTLVIDGIEKFYVGNSYFVGELQDSSGEEPGMLTYSHIRLEGKPSGNITVFLCHLRMARNHLVLAANFDELYLRQLNLVQCDNSIHFENENVKGSWIYKHGNASQLDEPLELKNVSYAQVTSSRFIIPDADKSKKNFEDRTGGLVPMIIMDKVGSSLVAGNFLRSDGVLYKESANGALMGNHFYQQNGGFYFHNSEGFSASNNYSQSNSADHKSLYRFSEETTEIIHNEVEVLK